jgi:hypothetical protein
LLVLLVVVTCSVAAWVAQRHQQQQECGSDADDDGEGDEGDDDLDLADGADLEDLYDEAVAKAVAAGEFQFFVLDIFAAWVAKAAVRAAATWQ